MFQKPPSSYPSFCKMDGVLFLYQTNVDIGYLSIGILSKANFLLENTDLSYCKFFKRGLRGLSTGLPTFVRHLTREKDEEDGVEGGLFGECDPRGDAEWSAEKDAVVVACLFRLYRDRNRGREACIGVVTSLRPSSLVIC